MLNSWFVIGIMAAAIAIVAQQSETQEPSAQDKQFVAEVASGGMLEVRLGQFVSGNAVAVEVKHFAETMVNDHTKANEELRAIASEKSVETPKVLNHGDQEILDRLEKLSGAELDKAYVGEMVEIHKHSIAAFEKEDGQGSEVRIKGFAEKTLPTLRHHLDMAEKIAADRR